MGSHDTDGTEPIATLWRVTLDADRLACAVYRVRGGFELRLESATAVVLHEPFTIQPRAMARAQALKHALERRGWRAAD